MSEQGQDSVIPNAPAGSGTQLYQNKQNDNTEFNRWLKRGMFLAVVPSIIIGKNFGLFMFIERLLIMPSFVILALVFKLTNRNVKKDKFQQQQSLQVNIPKKTSLIEKMFAFVGGFGIGLAICVGIVESLMAIFRL